MEEPAQQVIVRQYGLRPPLDWGEDCHEQLFLQNKLWNTLVEIERDNAAQWQAVFTRDHYYAELRAELDTVLQAIDSAWEARKKARSQARAKAIPEDEAHAELIKDLAERRKDLWQTLKALRTELKPRFQADLDALELDRRARVKRARQESGLWWCNYNAVVEAYTRARGRTLQTGGRLRFHAFSGTGRFVNQIQGGLSVSDLFAGKHSQIQIEPVPLEAFTSNYRCLRRKFQRTVFTCTVYTGKDPETGKAFRRTLSFPMTLHRPLPETARIKAVEVVCRREAGGLAWSAVFTCTQPAQPVNHTSPSAVGINLGWRKTAAGIRVATWVDSRGQEGHYHLGDKVIARLDHCERLQSELDEAQNAIRDRLAEWLQAENPPEAWGQMAPSVAKSRAPHRLAQLAIAWREWDWAPEWRAELETWRKADKRKRQEMLGLKAHALRHRRECYRILAKQWADGYALVGLGQMNLKQAAAKVKGKAEETALPAPVRRLRQQVCLSELTEWIGKQAAKTGAQVLTAARPVTDTCHACGQRSPIPADQLVHQCRHCGTITDRDFNAAKIALQDAIGGSAQSAKKPEHKPRIRKAPAQRPAHGLEQ